MRTWFRISSAYSHATTMLRAGVSLPALMKLLGCETRPRQWTARVQNRRPAQSAVILLAIYTYFPAAGCKHASGAHCQKIADNA